MLNLLINPKKAKKHPIIMMFIGIFYSSISILLSTWIFPEQSSIVMVFLTVLSCIYVVQGSLKKEEETEYNYKPEKWILKQHSKLIMLLLFLFLGFVFSYTFWALMLPPEKVLVIFNLQNSIVEGIKFIASTGNSVKEGTFFLIISNNLKVMLISLLFAFFYGAGAIFILVWNASVMGFVIGSLAKESFGIISLPMAFTRYFIHGIPEMLSYLTISIAGGIIYTSLFKGDPFREGRTKRIITDFLILIGISILIIIIAGFIEVYISPFL